MSNHDALGDRMKMYEGREAQRKFLPGLPIVARIDGRRFSKFTKGLDRPYDTRMSNAMVETTKYLVEHTNAVVGYTQSDEITLVWTGDSDLWFGRRVQKMTSQLAAQATIAFYRAVVKYLPPEYANKIPTFDARVWEMPSEEEAVNAILWREWDATKNSVSMAASHYYSHKQLHKKNEKQKQDMLMDVGVNWNDYPAFFKRGTYVRRVISSEPFTSDEIDKLPEKHNARTNPDLIVTRSKIEVGSLPILTQIKNRVGVLLYGATPITESEYNGKY